MNQHKKVYLFDAMALIYRAHFAFIKNPLINSKGFNVSAITGFVNTLHEIITKYNATHAAVVYDAPGLTDRAVEHTFYKANREASPEEIVTSIPYIKAIVKGMNIPSIELAGYEADDLIGTLAKKAARKGYSVYMVTPDKDFAQLVEENIYIHKPPYMGKGHEVLDLQAILDKWEIDRPEQVIDILGMWGDSIDNIPGIPGVGEKTAKKFIKDYGSMEGLYEHVGELKGKMQENIIAFKEQAFISKQLATIILDAPVDFNEKEFEVDPPNAEVLSPIFNELEFRTIGKRILGENYQYQPGGATSASIPVTNGQMDLFSTVAHPQTTKEVDPPKIVEEEPIATKNAENVQHQYHLVQTDAEIEALIQTLNAKNHFCFDSETTGLDANNCEIVGLSFANQPFVAYYVPIPENRAEANKILAQFQPILKDASITKIGQNIKYDMVVLKQYGIEIEGAIFDTMVAHYLLDTDARHNMNILAENFLSYTPISIETLIGKKGIKQGNMRDVALDKITEYAAEDADITYQLYEIFEQELKNQEFQKLYQEIEAPLIPVLADMESTGVTIDKDFLDEYSVELEEDINGLKKQIFEEAGVTFNMDSPKQLGTILFEKMKIPYVGKKTKTGQYSTDEETLSKLEEESNIIKNILDYRELSKLKSTYVDALPKLINPKTGRVHTTFNQTIAATGRLSSINPNLQNIPIRTDRGKKIRKAFIPSNEHNLLLSADYSQVELRIVAAISKDQKMIEAFLSGADIHAATAANVFNVALDAVDGNMRRKAKMVNFGIIYGISAFGLSQRLGIKRSEAAELIENYFIQYQGIKQYMEDAVNFARENGFAATLFGRKRYLRDITSRNHTLRSFAERNAINSPIQGTAADIIKLAMIKVQEKIMAEKLQTKMVLQVHDELLFDVPRNEIEQIQPIVRDGMQNAAQLIVPLEVEIGIGTNWLEAH
jgi:DNA polymerase-1